MTTLIALLGGAGLAAGLLTVWSGLFGRSGPQTTRPPSRLAAMLRRPLQPQQRRRSAAAAVTGMVVLVATRWPAAAIAAGLAAAWLPRVMSGRPVARQLERLEAIEQWVRKLAGLLGASRGLEDTLQTSVHHTPAPIRAEVGLLAARLRSGMNLDEALYRFADDLDDPVADLVAGALIHASQVRGRGVQHLLTDLAAMVADDVTGRREVEASRAPHRTTIRGLAVIFALFGAALAARPDYSAAYDTVLGQLVLAVVLGVCGTGLVTMHRLASQAPVERFLTKPGASTRHQGKAGMAR
ncbi:type II secretion system F family protein [Actinomadura sp. SCN-SB]|uniref:type II secretion system F family protein n=1 Tax=Actinomadura sp. SCN-SB TaxID=3373092 RepID=UPI0037503C08